MLTFTICFAVVLVNSPIKTIWLAGTYSINQEVALVMD